MENTTPFQGAPSCPVCQHDLVMTMPHGKRSGMPSIMLVCGVEGRHFRAFLNEQSFIARVVQEMGQAR